MRYALWRVVVISTTLFFAGSASADLAWPTRAITLIVPGAAGGTTDVPARLVAQKLSEKIGQPVIVENRPGSGGIIGTQAALRQPADGYTVVVGNTGSHAINYSAYKKLPYTPDDFVPLTDMISFANVLVVNPSLPYTTVSELIAAMRNKDIDLSYASAGIGQTTHLTAELFKTRVQGLAEHIPYAGATPATLSVIQGDTHFMFDNLTQALPQIKAGKLRALAVTSATPMASLADTPTITSQGVKEFVVTGWLGFFAVKGTPLAIQERLSSELSKILQDDEIKEKFTAMGGIVGGRVQSEFTTYVTQEIAMWQQVIDEQDLVLD